MNLAHVPPRDGPDPGPTAAEVPPAAALYRLLNGYLVGRAIHVAAQLGVADVLRDGPRRVVEIAQAIGADPTALRRLLRALVSVGLFHQVDADSFALTPVGDCLRDDSHRSLRAFACLFGSDAYLQAFAQLGAGIQRGRSGFDLAFGTPIYSYLGQHPDFAAIFDAGLTNLTAMVNPAVLTAYDFSEIRTIVDVGGGQGALLLTILRANPAMRGILFDLPRVAAGARARIDAAGLAERCSVVEGDMVEDVPEGADAYIIKNVLMDRDDAEAIAVLRNCVRGLRGKGRVVVIDPVLPPEYEPSPTPFIDLIMLVTTEGGRCRTATEFQALFDKAGLTQTRVIPTPSPVSIVEGRPTA